MSNASVTSAASRHRASERRNIRIAVLAVAFVGIVTALVFGAGVPSNAFMVRGEFRSVASLVPGSAVRIAGVDVGQVSSLGPGPGHTTIVSMTLNQSALPVHTDATLSIEPRLILEGNFYVNIDPGTPGTPQLRSGDLIPPQQSSAPVQLDQLLDTFDATTRSSLTDSIGELSEGLGGGGSRTSTLSQEPGYLGLRDTAHQLDNALGDITAAAHAAQGTDNGDLDRAIRHSRDFAVQLARNPGALRSIVSDYESVVGAFADEARPLQASIVKLNATLKAAPSALSALNGALPTLTHFSRKLRPALRAAPVPLRQATGALNQTDQIAAPDELPELLRYLRPATRALPGFETDLARLLPLVTSATQCLTTRVIPVLDTPVNDGTLSTGDPVWLDLLHAATGITSVTGGFDGNGSAVRAGVTLGTTELTNILPGIGNIVALTPPISGVRPEWLGSNVVPPFRPDTSCVSQPLAQLHASSGPAPDWMRASQKDDR